MRAVPAIRFRETRIVKHTPQRLSSTSAHIVNLQPNTLSQLFHHISSSPQICSPGTNLPSISPLRQAQLLANFAIPYRQAVLENSPSHSLQNSRTLQITELPSSSEVALDSEDERILAAYDSPSPIAITSGALVPYNQPQIPQIETVLCTTPTITEHTILPNSIQVPRTPSPDIEHHASIDKIGDQESAASPMIPEPLPSTIDVEASIIPPTQEPEAEKIYETLMGIFDNLPQSAQSMDN